MKQLFKNMKLLLKNIDQFTTGPKKIKENMMLKKKQKKKVMRRMKKILALMMIVKIVKVMMNITLITLYK